MKKLISLCLSLCMAIGLTACGSTSSGTPNAGGSAGGGQAADPGETYTLVFSHENAESSFIHQVCLQFKEKVEEATDGHVIIDIYPNAQLGSKTDNWQAISDNSVQMLLGVGSHMDSRFSALTIPCLYSSVEDCYKAMDKDSEFFQAIEAVGEEIGLKILLEVPIGFRTMSTNVKTTCFEDIAGQDIRVMEMPEYISLWGDAFGANPTPIAFSELYLALQQGLVDAQENPLDVIVTNALYEQQDYIVPTNHEPFYFGLTINMQTWNSLPAEYQNAMLDVVEEIREIAYEGGIEAEAAAAQTMIDAGVTMVEFTDEDYAKMQAACQDTVYNLYRDFVGDDLFELALRVADEVKQ